MCLSILRRSFLVAGLLMVTRAVPAGVLALQAMHGDDGNQRWRDVADQAYAPEAAGSHNAAVFYEHASVTVSYQEVGETFLATLDASGLKPNFCYQVKLEGLPGEDPTGNDIFASLGRYWAEGDIGYIIFDGFVTDSNGSATVRLYLDTSYHVFWKEGQSMPSFSYSMGWFAIDPDALALAYDGTPWYLDSLPAQTIELFGEIEHEETESNDQVGECILPEHTYIVNLAITEESFHSQLDEGGYWATVMGQKAVFAVDYAAGASPCFDDWATTLMDSPVTVDVLANDWDLTTVVSVGPPNAGSAQVNADNTITYTPPPGYFGEAVFTYTAEDASGVLFVASVSVMVTADGVLETAVLQVDAASPSTALGAVLSSNDERWAIGRSEAASFSFQDLAVATDTSLESVVLYVEHHEDPGTAEGSIIWDVGDPEIAAPIRMKSSAEGVDAWDLTDVVGSVLVVNDLLFSISNFDRKTTYIDHIYLEITYLSAPASTPPVAADDIAETLEDTAVTIDVLVNDVDPDGNDLALTIASVTQPAFGTAAIDNNMVVYTPDLNAYGTDTFSYTVRDETGMTAEGAVTVSVLPVNDAPVAVDDDATTAPDTAVIIDVLANDWDVEGSALFCVAAGPATTGTVTVAADGLTLTYTPNAGFTGVDTFSYTVSDGELEASALVSVSVQDNTEPTMLVSAIVTGSKWAGPNLFLQAVVTVRDAVGNPVDAAAVTVDFTMAGFAPGTASGQTDAQGMVELTSEKIRGAAAGEAFVVTVTVVTKDGLVWDQAASQLTAEGVVQ